MLHFLRNSFDSTEAADCLRAQPMETLVEAQIKTHVPGPSNNDGVSLASEMLI